MSVKQAQSSALFHMNVTNTYWCDAVLAACYHTNNMLSTVFDCQIPLTVLSLDTPLFTSKGFWVCLYVCILGLGVD